MTETNHGDTTRPGTRHRACMKPGTVHFELELSALMSVQ